MSEIKSEKAYDIIHDNYPKYPCEGGDIGEICYETDDTVTCIDAAERAIVQAEYDARYRATKAYKMSCGCFVDTEVETKPCLTYEHYPCPYLGQFKQAYDNEEENKPIPYLSAL